MRQIITIHVGGCGSRIGQALWSQLLNQHQLTAQGEHVFTDQLTPTSTQTYFSQQESRHVPRMVLVDTDCNSVDRMRVGQLGNLFSQDNLITARMGSSSTFASGFYGAEPLELCTKAMEAFRREAENCESVECIQITHSMTGGSGSGLQSKLLSEITLEYPELPIHGIAVAPSSGVSNSVLDVYNFVLGSRSLIEWNSITNLIQNSCLSRICCQHQNIFKPTFRSMNDIVARLASNITLSIRFPGNLNTGIRKINTNLIPFPRLHFLTAGMTPFSAHSSRGLKTAESFIASAYACNSLLSEIDWRQGRFFATANIFSGNQFSNSEVEEALAKHKQNNANFYTDWIPDGMHCSISGVPQNQQPSLTALMNSSNTRIMLMRLASEFTSMFRRKAFLHHYTRESMDEMEFTEAESNMNDLCCQFPQAMYNMGDYSIDELDFEQEIE